MTRPAIPSDSELEDASFASGADFLRHDALENNAPTTISELLRTILHREDDIAASLAEIKAMLPGSPPPHPARPVQTTAQVVIAEKHSDYMQLVARVRQVVRQTVPPGATIAVVSKGDEHLLKLEGLNAWHFPRRDDGVYAGHHPADSAAAISHLDQLREKGADYFLLPQTAFWWLDHYREFRDHLDARHRVVVRQEDACIIYALRDTSAPHHAESQSGAAEHHLLEQFRRLVRLLLPVDAKVLVVGKGEPELIDLQGLKASPFPQDATGVYAGYYPADSADAIAHLGKLRKAGAEYLVFPKEAFWWLTFYCDFAAHLARRCRLVTRQEHVCIIFDLRRTT